MPGKLIVTISKYICNLLLCQNFHISTVVNKNSTILHDKKYNKNKYWQILTARVSSITGMWLHTLLKRYVSSSFQHSTLCGVLGTIFYVIVFLVPYGSHNWVGPVDGGKDIATQWAERCVHWESRFKVHLRVQWKDNLPNEANSPKERSL